MTDEAKLSYKVIPSICDNGDIAIETQMLMDGLIAQTSRMVCQLQDEAIRSVLIHLGWTPPNEDKHGAAI